MMITKLEMSLKLCWLCSKTLTWSCETDIKSFQKTFWRANLPWYFCFTVTSWIIWSLPPLCWEKLFRLHHDTKEQNCDYMYNCRTRCRPQRVNTPKTAWCQRWISAHSHHSFIHSFIYSSCYWSKMSLYHFRRAMSVNSQQTFVSNWSAQMVCIVSSQSWSFKIKINCIIIFSKADTGETLVTRTCVLEDMNSQCGLFKFQVTRDWKYNDPYCPWQWLLLSHHNYW